MKNVLLFIAGAITGIILLLIMLAIIANEPWDNKLSDNSITLFEKEGECVSGKSFKVFQVLDSGDALAREFKELDYYSATGLTVLFLAKDGTSYYDEQIIEALEGKCAKQIGVCKIKDYGKNKTIPIVAIRPE